MEKRLVRIYKDPSGTGEYKNKTKAFLERAQEGRQVAQQKNPRVYLNYIYEQLNNEEDPNDVFASLVANGLDKDTAYKLLSTVVDQMVESGDLNADNSVTKNQRQEEAAQQEEQVAEPQETEEELDAATEYFNSYAGEAEARPQELEFQMGGYPRDENVEEEEEVVDNEQEESEESEGDLTSSKTVYPGLEEYYVGYEPISWNNIDTLTDATPSYKKGGSKKAFAKNVLGLIKKQEGGQEAPEENKPMGQGNPFDNISDDVSNRKSKFLEVIKDKANTAKLKDIYEKMMKSGDPSLMQTAQTLQNGTPEQTEQESPMMMQQTGGYTGGEDQPEMFMYGGTDVPFYEADYLPEAKKGRNFKLFNKGIYSDDVYNQSGAYNVNDKSKYTGDLKNHHLVERKVTKTGIFGRPKEWTDIYSNSPERLQRIELDKPGTKSNTSNKNSKDWVSLTGPKHAGMSDEEWDDTSFSAKRAIRKGDRQAKRNERRYNKQLQKDKEFEAFGKDRPSVNYMFDNEEDYNRDWKGLELDDDMNPIPYTLKGDVYQVADNPSYKQMYKLAGTEYKPVDFNSDPSVDWNAGRTKYYQKGGLYKAQDGVKTPTRGLSTASDPTGAIQLPENPNSFASITNTFMNQNVPVNKEASTEPVYYMDPRMNGSISGPEESTVAIDTKRNRNWNMDGEAAVNKFNSAAHTALGFINRINQNKQEKEMYENNFTSDNLYAHSNDKDRGDWVDYGSQLGQYRFDQMGQSANGRFSYGQSGGFMQEGGMTEGDEVEMTEEELQEFLANGGEVEYL